MKGTVAREMLLRQVLWACFTGLGLSTRVSARSGRWGATVGFIAPSVCTGRLCGTSGSRWMHHEGVARGAGRETETLEWVAAARGGGKDTNLLDMVMRKKDQFVSAVLEMEYQAQLEVAEGLLFFIRRSTNGGMLPSADGTPTKLDPKQREILSEFVPQVLKIMDRLEKSGLDDARVYLYGTEALGYDLSLKSALHAAAYIPRISRNIDMMVSKHPEVNGGAPYIVQGMMCLNAPQPLRNVRKARECFEEAYKIDPLSARNNYFCGVAAFLQHDFKQAYDFFTRALQLSEAQEEQAEHLRQEAIDAYLTAQCRRGIQLTTTRMVE